MSESQTPGVGDLAGPMYLGNQYYSDRNRVPTNYGVVRLDSETIWRFWNGAKQEIVGGHYEADCPCCYRTHTVEGTDDDARFELRETVLACCDDVEWQPPSDFLDPCGVCGHSHRERHDCTPPSFRDPKPDFDAPASCTECEWSIDQLGETPTHSGSCPECGSAAVNVGDSDE